MGVLAGANAIGMTEGPRDGVHRQGTDPGPPTPDRQEEEGGRESVKQTDEKY